MALALAGMPDLLNRSVEEIMSTGPISVRVDTPMPEILATFERELVRRLLVLDAEGLLVGVISWKDMATEANAREVGEVVHEIVDSPTTA
ncbi:MAG: CBS domain-containing protein [Isosphaeraceae bacterium]